MRILSTLAAALLVGTAAFAYSGDASAAAAGPTCNLKSASSKIKHVVFLVFDNTHLTRDNPNVPSELEQMPALLNFMQGKGMVLSRHYTSLIQHTTVGVVTSISGLYGDRMGVTVSNSLNNFRPDGTTSFESAFTYWTAPILDPSGSDKTPNMINELGVVAPAPWVPFTRAGCDWGAYSTANVEFENVNTNATGDVATVFGPNSPEFAEVKTQLAAGNPQKTKNMPNANYEGIAIHCAIGSKLCDNVTHPGAKAVPDLLKNEPGGYKGYMALFGNKYVQPAISPNGPVLDLNGVPIQDSTGNPGFPGFSGPIPSTLGYVAQMLEAGIPIVNAYLGDTHDGSTRPAGATSAPGGASGPGEADYVARLAANNQAFAAFFQRLKNDGIDETNTLFIITADENDHFAGTQTPSPAGCDGVNIACNYITAGVTAGPGVNLNAPLNTTVNLGEVHGNLAAMLKVAKNNTTKFDTHFDSAPTIFVLGDPATPIRPQTDAVVRQLERDVGSLQWINPLPGRQNPQTVAERMIDHAGMQMVHMMSADPLRNATFVMFGPADSFFDTSTSNGLGNGGNEVNKGFAWIHGDYQDDIGRTWLGMVGPGVPASGRDDILWSDHVDIRPTMMALTGLRDDFVTDGRVLVEKLDPAALPSSLAGNASLYAQLAAAYKRINASDQDLGQAILIVNTKALKSGSAVDDSTYTSLEAQIASLTAQRDALAAQMKTILNNTAFKGAGMVSAGQVQSLIDQANALVAAAQALE